MASNMNLMIALCLCCVALGGVKGQPISSPSLITQYLTEMCSFYLKESAAGCNFEDVIEDVKEHGENLEQPRQPIPNWDGNQVETYLDQAQQANTMCTAQGTPIKSACAAMDAVCGPTPANLILCSAVTAAPATTSPVATGAPGVPVAPTNQPVFGQTA